MIKMKFVRGSNKFYAGGARREANSKVKVLNVQDPMFEKNEDELENI